MGGMHEMGMDGWTFFSLSLRNRCIDRRDGGTFPKSGEALQVMSILKFCLPMGWGEKTGSRKHMPFSAGAG